MMALLYLLVAFSAIILHSAQSQVTGSHIVASKLQDKIMLPCFSEPWKSDVNNKLLWEFFYFINEEEKNVTIIEVIQMNKFAIAKMDEDHYDITEEQLKKGNLSISLYNPTIKDSGTYICSVENDAEKKVIASIEVLVPEHVDDCGCLSVYESCEDFLFFVGAGATLPTLSLLFPLVGSIICPPRIPQMLSRNTMKAKLRRRRKIIRKMDKTSLKLHSLNEENTEGTEILIDPQTLAKTKPSCPRPRVDNIV
uniref:Ig-like domain-containing protein n=1 Tax=Eptatretus burgeri TaxID=7764 RepID=A0A8C4R6S7_EPTBU